MHNNYIKELLGFKDVKIKKIEDHKTSITIHIETKQTSHICPCCGNHTSKVHDYRIQTVKDMPILFKHTLLKIRKRRYKCKYCGKQFYEKIPFLSKYYRTTSRLTQYVFDELKTVTSMKQIAQKANISNTTVSSRFDLINYSLNKLPSVLSIDEFRGNAGGEKYQCFLVDAEHHKALDVLPNRSLESLCEYFKKFNDRDKVRILIMDMWRPYYDIARTYFKNALIVIDKYHYVRQNTWAFESIRKREQNRLGKYATKIFKGSRKILLSNPNKLSNEEKMQLNAILSFSEDLRQGYCLKQMFYEFSNSTPYKEAKPLLSKFILLAQNSDIPEYIKLANTLLNWSEEILNSFRVPYTNGVIEGMNNKIKVIKRNAYGVRNFNRFRNSILHCFN